MAEIRWEDNYVPYHINKKHQYSLHLLNLKSTKVTKQIRNQAESYMAGILTAMKMLLNDDDILIVVPSSRMDNSPSPFQSFVGRTFPSQKFITGLERTQTVEKATEGGSRKVDTHVETLKLSVAAVEAVLNKRVVLLDDVSTTGSSLIAACEVVSRDGKPVEISCYCLGRTIPARSCTEVTDVGWIVDAITLDDIQLKAKGIVSVVNNYDYFKLNVEKYKKLVLHVPVEDGTADLTIHFDKTNKFIGENKPVVVHCWRGKSRSVAVMFAYLLSTGISWNNVEKAIGLPTNQHFRDQLTAYAKFLQNN